MDHRFTITYHGTPGSSTEDEATASVDGTDRPLSIANLERLAITLKATHLACQLAGEDAEQIGGILEPASNLIVVAHAFLGLDDIYQLDQVADALSGIVEMFRAGPDADAADERAQLNFPTIPNHTTRTGNA